MQFNVHKQLILASGSPRREELLKMLGVPFDIVTSDIVENDNGLSTSDFVEFAQNNAVNKAVAVSKDYPNAAVIGADTIVGLGTTVFPKPDNAKQAKEYLKALSGQVHTVVTVVAIVSNGETHTFSSQTKVTFYELEDALIDAYIASGDSADKAGAYGIQSGGALFVKSIEGDYYSVMGLPIAALYRQLLATGIVSLKGGA